MKMADKYQILNELKSILSDKLGDDLKEVILFGSHAYGGAHANSDYDFLIFLHKNQIGSLEIRFQIIVTI